MSEDIWEGAEVISVYDDSQAIEDGLIVDITVKTLSPPGKVKVEISP